MTDKTINQFDIEFNQTGGKAKHKPNPNYPKGIDVDVSQGAKSTCTTPVGYPAKCIGFWSIECRVCRQKAAVTAAGRADDPRSVKLPCKIATQN